MTEKIQKAIDNDTLDVLADETTIDEFDRMLAQVNKEQEELDKKKQLLYTLYTRKKKLKDADIPSIEKPKRKRKSTGSK